MRFNPYTWSLYSRSPEGEAAIQHFETLLDPSADGEEDGESGEEGQASPGPAPTGPDSETPTESSEPEPLLTRWLGSNEIALAVSVCAEAETRIEDGQDASALYETLLSEGLAFDVDGESIEFGGPDHAKEWLRALQASSLGLALAAPDEYVPYFYCRRFDEFERLCVEFDIPLPRLPGKAGLEDRCLYYLQLNGVLKEFRGRHGLSAGELCAFLYDFAPKQIEEASLELPEAGKAWFLMGGVGGPEDFETLDGAEEDDQNFWQGNLETQPGDVCIMWCVSPRSSIHSIWRATTHGFIDPFFGFYSQVWIGHPVRVPSLTFKELAADDTWSKKPAVKAHFQGASGKPVTVEEYDALLAMLEKKGFDRSLAPTLRQRDFSTGVKIDSERDVEVALLEPLLRELGYAEQDWTRQLRLRMGRGERVYPDYAFLSERARGDEVAHWVVEAKYRIDTKRALADAYQQAKSYALRLQARRFALAATEGLWLFEADRTGFVLDRHEHRTWAELRHPDVFRALETRFAKGAFARVKPGLR